MARYTDDDIRSMKKVTAKIAAVYLFHHSGVFNPFK